MWDRHHGFAEAQSGLSEGYTSLRRRILMRTIWLYMEHK